jgi:predicted glycosyltransferase
VRQAEKSSVAIEVMRSVPDLPARLANARLSISQAGYNTVADILTAGCAAVLVPFAAGGETEQTARAGLLAASRRAVMAAEADLTPELLAAAADEALALPRARPQMLGGGARTAAILLEELAASTSARMSARMRLEPEGGVVSSHAVRCS